MYDLDEQILRRQVVRGGYPEDRVLNKFHVLSLDPSNAFGGWFQTSSSNVFNETDYRTYSKSKDQTTLRNESL